MTQLKSGKKKSPSLDDVELFQRFMIDEMGLWEVKDGQVVEKNAPHIPLSKINKRFAEYKKKRGTAFYS